MIVEVAKGFLILFLVFVPLERLFSLHGQKIFRQGWGTDVIYYFTGYFIGRAGALFCTGIALLLIGGQAVGLALQSRVAAQPIWLQFLEAVVIADVGYYTAHRLLHTVPWLWKFHAVHHSIEEMDWLATVRVHPIDQVFTKLMQMIPLYWLGFSLQTFGFYTLFSAAIAFYIHANIRLQARVLKWIVATPEFHHWHHANEPGVRNKNLAAQLPLMDFLFGTLYLPRDRYPRRYGIKYPIPSDYLKQFINPFQQLLIPSRRNNTMTTEHPIKKKPLYLRPLPLVLCLALVSGLGAVGIAKANNYSLKTSVVTFIGGLTAKKVTTEELEQKKVQSVVLIDVRTPQEHQDDHIGKTPLVPLDEIQTGIGMQKIEAIARASTQANQAQPTVVLYCNSGPRSVQAYQTLQQSGTKLNLAILTGGIKAWRQSVPPARDMEILTPISVPVTASTRTAHTGAPEKP